jgi:hypothetical protein
VWSRPRREEKMILRNTCDIDNTDQNVDMDSYMF